MEIAAAYTRLVLLLAAPVWLFAMGYLSERRWWFTAWIGIFLAAALGVFRAGNWFTFIVLWEGITVSLLGLLLLGPTPIALLYAVVQLTGATALLVGLTAAFSVPGGAQFDILVVWPANLWLFTGFAVKAGLFGVHQWLPIVHGNAPAPVSALLSGFTVSVGIWGMMHVVTGPSPLLALWGGSAAVYGGVQAFRQRDIKQFLAFSTISHVGIMFLALSVGTEGARVAAAAHAFGHGLFKGLLFLVAGYLEEVHGSRDIYKIAAIERWNPFVFAGLFIGGLGMVGTPWFAGYPGKYLIKKVAEGNPWAVLVLALISVLSAAYGGKILVLLLKRGRSGVWFSLGGRDNEHVVRAGVGTLRLGAMTAALGLLGASTFFFGISPRWVTRLVGAEVVYHDIIPTWGPVVAGLFVSWMMVGVQRGQVRMTGKKSGLIVFLGHAARMVQKLAFLAQEAHNGDVGRYLQWFLLGAVIIFLFLRLS